MKGHAQRPDTRRIEDPAETSKKRLAKQGASTHEAQHFDLQSTFTGSAALRVCEILRTQKVGVTYGATQDSINVGSQNFQHTEYG